MRLARWQDQFRRTRRAAAPTAALAVMTALLIGALHGPRLHSADDNAAAWEPLSIVERPGDDPSARHVAAGGGAPSSGNPASGPSALATERRSGSCVLIRVL